MKRGTRAVACAGALALAVVLAAPSADAGTIPAVQVTGVAACGTNGQYTITWTVTNPSATETLAVNSATVTGSVSGTVTITPNPIPASSSGTGTSGPVAGNTTGPAVLSVNWTLGEMTDTSAVTVNLAGNCTPTSTTSSSSSTSSTSTTRPTTTLTVVPVTVSPRFTG